MPSTIIDARPITCIVCSACIGAHPAFSFPGSSWSAHVTCIHWIERASERQRRHVTARIRSVDGPLTRPGDRYAL